MPDLAHARILYGFELDMDTLDEKTQEALWNEILDGDPAFDLCRTGFATTGTTFVLAASDSIKTVDVNEKTATFDITTFSDERMDSWNNDLYSVCNEFGIDPLLPPDGDEVEEFRFGWLLAASRE